MTYDGTTVKVNQSGKKALDVVGSVDISENINITGSTKITSLNKENAIVFTNQNGTLENQSTLTYDGTTVKVNQSGKKALDVVGSVDISENINITGSTKITSLNKENAIVFTNQNGTLENQSTLTYDGTTVKVNQSGKIALDVVGSVDISENINVSGD